MHIHDNHVCQQENNDSPQKSLEEPSTSLFDHMRDVQHHPLRVSISSNNATHLAFAYTLVNYTTLFSLSLPAKHKDETGQISW